MDDKNSNEKVEIKDEKFAKEEKEAIAKFDKYKRKDPFSNIKPALLNSSDIYDYVRVTGMIYPFYKDKLKSASYEVNLLGKVIYWDEKGERKSYDLKEGVEFPLIKNSIAFVEPEPIFRLPNYIALRFNLKIMNVHRGILLGTGPLIDPGFEGKLLIPLHNLTNNNYKFIGGEGFIWVEFTKISANKNWIEDTGSREHSIEYKEFPEDKKNLKPENYLEKAMEGQSCSSIRSSLPGIILNAKKGAEDASNSAKKASESAEASERSINIIKWIIGTISIVAILALISSLFGIYISIHSLINDVSSDISSISHESISYIDNTKNDIEKYFI